MKSLIKYGIRTPLNVDNAADVDRSRMLKKSTIQWEIYEVDSTTVDIY